MNNTNAIYTNGNSCDGGTTSWDNKHKNEVSVTIRDINGNYTNIEVTEKSVTIKPRRLHGKLGCNYEIFSLLGLFITFAPIRVSHTNIYKKLHEGFQCWGKWR